MYRFFVPEEGISEETVRIQGDDVNHIKNVLRMKTGEQAVVSCGRGTDYFCIIEEMGENEIRLHIEEKRPVQSELPVGITLFQALPKRDKMELVIQKAVELGAVRIVPVKAKRCVVKMEKKKEEKKIIRWQSIAESAAKQSGRGRIPKVERAMTWNEALAEAKEMDRVLIPYELCGDMAESVGIMEQAAREKSIGIFIGPEGGFERSEVEQAVSCGALPISLGERILRTETAGLAVLSVLMFLIEGREARKQRAQDGEEVRSSMRL